jgi:hypothetical protein
LAEGIATCGACRVIGVSKGVTVVFWIHLVSSGVWKSSGDDL